MTQCNYPEAELERETETKVQEFRTLVCPSCGEAIQTPADQVGELVHELSGLPAGVKFDPTDQEILEHLEAKVLSESGGGKLHPLIDEFIPTLETPNGICYTHPENLPGVSKDSQVRHFFNRPSMAYTTGSRKRRRVQGEDDGSETRWHKTGRTRPISCDGIVKGFKKILVLYTNYGRKRKPQKTNWVMHQYHIGANEEEKDGQLVVSKVFYQKQPRPSGLVTGSGSGSGLGGPLNAEGISDGHGHDLLLEYHDKPPFICYDELGNIIPVGLVPCLGGEGHTSSASATSNAKGPC